MNDTLGQRTVAIGGWAVFCILWGSFASGQAPPAGGQDPSADETSKRQELKRQQQREHDEAVQRALDECRKTLQSAREANERAVAVWKLGEAEKDAKIVAELSARVMDAELVRREAMAALTCYRHDAKAAEALVRALSLNVGNPSLLAKNLEALGNVGHASSIPHVARFLERHQDPHATAAAARALARIHNASAVDALASAWSELDGMIKRGGIAKGAAEGRWNVVGKPIKDALAELTGQSLSTPEEYKRWWAQNRGAYRPKEATPVTLCRKHFIPVDVPGKAARPGTIVHEVWTDAGRSLDGFLASGRLETPPAQMRVLTSFASPKNIGDYFVARIRGYLLPPEDGAYTFHIDCDDDAVLFLSQDDRPDAKAQIAAHHGGKSPPILLKSGRAYYIEALHYESKKNDHVMISWELPSEIREVIPGVFLAPLDGAAETATAFIAAAAGEAARGGAAALPASPAGPEAAPFIANTRPDRYCWDTLAPGKRQYQDRPFTLTTIPASFENLPYLRSLCDDKRTSGPDLVAFESDRDVTVYIAHDTRISKRPDWMAGFTDTGESLTAQHGAQQVFRIWSKAFPTGRIALGGNIDASERGASFGMYLVIVRPSGAPGATPAAPRDGFVFYRAVNLNGPALSIDGNAWEAGGEASNCLVSGRPFDQAAASLAPPADEEKSRMLQTGVTVAGSMSVLLGRVPAGTYRVFLYVWAGEGVGRFGVSLDGREVMPDREAGDAGRWERLGPWDAEVRQGILALRCSGGALNVCGIEVWRRGR
jgi:hypothetical protein